jgi:alpha-mannosidase
MVDVILLPESEASHAFDLALGIEREFPAQTALGLCTPATVLPTENGPPHIGPSGWLFHLDAPNLMLTSFRPVPQSQPAVVATLLETTGFAGSAEMRCARNPSQAMLIDAAGNTTAEAAVFNDAVSLDVAANDLVRLKLEWK